MGTAPRVSRLGWAAALLGVAGWAGYAWGAQLALAGLAVRRGPGGARRVALSFDDGPDPRWTPALLDLLAARGVRATFFLVGERARRHPELVRAIVAGGHEVGNHSWHHRNAWGLGPRASVREVLGGARLLAELAGVWPRLYRPPWGIVNAAVLHVVRRLGSPVVLWSLQPEGLRPRPPDAQLAYCRARLDDGAIVDLHDAPGLPGAPERTLRLVPALLDLVAGRGYRAVPVGTLLGAD